jgi:hypothetical protein
MVMELKGSATACFFKEKMMIGSISGSLANISSASGSTLSTSISSANSQLIEALDLAGANFNVRTLGSAREIAAGMTLIGRGADNELRSLQRQLGETDQRVAQDVRLFIDDGNPGIDSSVGGLLARAAELNAMDNGGTRESRMQALLSAALELVERAREPGLNLLNVTLRTGLIVALTTVLRQMVGYYVEQAIREGASPESSQAWSVVAVTMIGPAMSLMGALRDEGAGIANLRTRLGRLCMASITMGALIVAHLTGASSSMLSTAINTTVYTFARDLCNAFIPLNDNAGPVTDKATAAAMVAFGAVQFSLEQLSPWMPASGPGRAAAGLAWSLGADVVAGALNSVGAVIDDIFFVLCRSWPLLSPQVGLGAVLVDPESLQREVLRVRAEARVPTAQQIGNALFNNGASRASAFMALVLALGAAATELSGTDYGENTQTQLVNISLGMMMMLIYFPFIWSCSQSAPEAKPAAQLQE